MTEVPIVLPDVAVWAELLSLARAAALVVVNNALLALAAVS